MTGFKAAVGCLTIVPVGSRGTSPDRALGASFLWFPLVGAGIGAALIGVDRMTVPWLPPMVGAALLVLAWIVVTGALHLDGLGDCCDGLYGGKDRQGRLRIMKDPHVGMMAVVALIVIILLKWSCLASLSPAARFHPLIVVPCLGRYAMVVLGTTLPYARAEGGTAEPFVRYANRWALAGATALAGLVTALTWEWRGMTLLGITVVVALGLRRVFARALGGITGDALGAACELTEGALLVFAVVLAR